MVKTSNLGLNKNDFSTDAGKTVLIRESMNELMGEFNDYSNMDIIDEAYGDLKSDISDINSEISLLPETYTTANQPPTWKAGDWWFQVVRERTSGIEQISTTLQTAPYNPTRNYHLKTKDTIETVENLDNGDLIVKI